MAPFTDPLGVGLIGCGAVAVANHVPGIRLCPQAELVALCDPDEGALQAAAQRTGVKHAYPDYKALLENPAVHAVIIATPNRFHEPIARAAAAAGKHILCEKPLAMDLRGSCAMLQAAEAAGIRHMTAFTYRFVPAMAYMIHLIGTGAIGTPYHFRSCRLQDWGDRDLGWRQSFNLAATGELGDMLSHRLDFAHVLVGPMSRLVADRRRFHPERGGKPSELEDWITIMAEHQNGATALLESSKVATGHGEGGQSQDFCEVNGSEGSLIYQLERPHEVQIGKPRQGGLSSVAVPEEFLKVPGAPRDPHEGDPLTTFRYDQDFEFLQAVQEQRPCRPSFHDGVRVQAVMEAALKSIEERRWVEVYDCPPDAQEA